MNKMRKVRWFSLALIFFGVLGLGVVIFMLGIANIDRNITAIYFFSVSAFIGFVLMMMSGVTEIVSIVRNNLLQKGRK